MIKFVTALLSSCMILFAYTDMDLDGVDDAIDKCPNTPITDLVDATGCSVRSLVSDQHFDIVMGVAYSQYNYRLNDKTDTWTTTAQIDYYNNNISLQLLTSYYSSESDDYDDSGMNDTTLAAYYQYNLTPDITLQAGAGIVFPTYDAEYNNNDADYIGSLNLSYQTDDYTLFGGYSFTYIGDDDVTYTGSDGNTYTIEYQHVNAFNIGVGSYVSSKLYASLSYYYSDSIYDGVDAIENITCYGFYSIDDNWFATGSYAYGLSDTTSDNYFAVRIGYYF
ncbi:DUF3187 domain-containing protein [Hydrogenimonas sp.]|uniref:DUF3187 domain-containing protein n=1 Tax=Hydrogenimonas sp. TaxID=2231112 RepID=UPI00261D34AF|nr:DUF3187 domain-containing protein [Hydrogenimonas sp.]